MIVRTSHCSLPHLLCGGIAALVFASRSSASETGGGGIVDHDRKVLADTLSKNSGLSQQFPTLRELIKFGNYSDIPGRTYFANWSWQMQDLPPEGQTISRFNVEMLPAVSSSFLGLGPYTTNGSALGAAYRAAFPDAAKVVYWFDGSRQPAVGLFAQVAHDVSLPIALRPFSTCNMQIPASLQVYGFPLGSGAVGFKLSGTVTNYRLCLVVMPTSENYGGHAWVEFRPGNGDSYARGLFPAKGLGIVSGRGVVDDRDATRPGQRRTICFSVTADQYAKAARYANWATEAWKSGEVQYYLISNNCTHFATDVIREAGISFDTCSSGFCTPSFLSNAIAGYSDPDTRQCGSVTVSGSRLAESAVTVPYEFDALLLAKGSIETPEDLALKLGLPLIENDPVDAEVLSGSSVDIRVSSTNGAPFIGSVGWVDPSIPAQYVSSQFVQVFPNAGVFRGTVGIVTEGAVIRVPIKINVLASKGPSEAKSMVLLPIVVTSPSDVVRVNTAEYATGMIPIPNYGRDCPTDLNGDNVTDDLDFSIFVQAYNNVVDSAGDFNNDSLSDDVDFSVFARAYDAVMCK
jgi:hypothetical protein